jgi:hypothetical protein|tara:strand:- start:505 stop:1071 length:567 start_codon:yes stop_codon:yes gene_type:complete
MINEKKVLFEISLIVGYLNDIDNEKINRDAIDNASNIIVSDNALHTFSEDSYIPKSDELNKIFKSIEDDFSNTTSLKFEINEHWAHIHKPNQSAGIHNHIPDIHPDEYHQDSNKYLSGVYYPYLPDDCGNIVFEWRNGIQGAIPNYRYSYEDAKVGSYLLFPSYLSHFITPNLSDYPRVSISFNGKIL